MGYRPWSRKESDTTEHTHRHTHKTTSEHRAWLAPLEKGKSLATNGEELEPSGH